MKSILRMIRRAYTLEMGKEPLGDIGFSRRPDLDRQEVITFVNKKMGQILKWESEQ